MYPHIFSPSAARAKSLWQRLVHTENWWAILNWLFFFPRAPSGPLGMYFSAMPFHGQFVFPSMTKFSSLDEGKKWGKVSHLRMCSWEEENLPLALSWEPAYGMKIRLNFTASVSASSQGVVGRKGWRCWPDFRVSSVLCFTIKTLVVRLYVYFGSSG